MGDLGIRRYVYIRKQYSAIGIKVWSETINSSHLRTSRWGTLKKLETFLTWTLEVQGCDTMDQFFTCLLRTPYKILECILHPSL